MAEHFNDSSGAAANRGRSDVLPQAALRSFLDNRSLISKLAKREVLGRYRGSLLGLAWSFFTPAVMLIVYTFFFGVVFPARWPSATGSTGEFALVLFAGLIVFNLFAECVNRAPILIVGNVSFVKKIIFPLDILSWVSLASGLFHAAVSLVVWLLFYVLIIGVPHPEILLVPIALLPFMLVLLGLGWLLGSLGVFLRDVSQVVAPLTVAFMFLSPIFYPLETLKGVMHTLVSASPLTFAIESVRGLMMWGRDVSWDIWLVQLIFALLFAGLSFAWFQKTKKGFADVL
jgi:lipopolysaccharide transport system permease protein